MTHYGICECCAARFGLLDRESRRERLWLTPDCRRLCRYHFEEHIDNSAPPRIVSRAEQDIHPDDCCTIEELREDLNIDD
jgi:hypothetical protein